MSHNVIPDLAQFLTPIDNLEHLPGNARVGDVGAVAKSLEEFGQHRPAVARRIGEVDGRPVGTVLVGNHMLAAAKQLGWTEIAVVWVEEDDKRALARALADNRTSDLGGYDNEALYEALSEVWEQDEELLFAASYTKDDIDALLKEAEPEEEETGTHLVTGLSLFDRFMVPPFSVLNGRDGWWMERKQAWIGLGIEGELGREDKPRTWYIAPPGTKAKRPMVDPHAADERREEE
jgi:hypothetical protein